MRARAARYDDAVATIKDKHKEALAAKDEPEETEADRHLLRQQTVKQGILCALPPPVPVPRQQCARVRAGEGLGGIDRDP